MQSKISRLWSLFFGLIHNLLASGNAPAESLLACQLASAASRTDDFSRIVVIGDVHGSLTGLQEVLYGANVTESADSCQWRSDSRKTLVVQVGDIVDRGPHALEAWECLEKLQKEGFRYPQCGVVRLLGNHDMWWLEGQFHHRNKTADTKENIKAIVGGMKKSVLDGRVQAAYVHRIGGRPILFTHAGIRAQYLKLLSKTIDVQNAEAVARHLNNVLARSVQDCENSLRCRLDDEAFQAGQDRGGSNVGGPFWTDFEVLENEAKDRLTQLPFLQVVGHTMAFCYHPRHPFQDPPLTFAECSLGLVRSAVHLQAVCVDGGMYLGARAFLEIGADGHFRAFQRFPSRDEDWQVRDLTAEVCRSGDSKT